MIKTHIFIRRQCWTAYMGKTVMMTDADFSSPQSIIAILSSLNVIWWVWLWFQYLNAALKTRKRFVGNLCSFAQPNPQCKYKGLSCVFRWSHRPLVLLFFLSFVHYQSIFPSLTHPSSFSSVRRRAIRGFEPHQWGTHPTHQQLESYSRKEQMSVRDMN